MEMLTSPSKCSQKNYNFYTGRKFFCMSGNVTAVHTEREKTESSNMKGRLLLLMKHRKH